MSIREDLKAYLDGELSPERAREVEAGIAASPELREECEQMKLLSSEIRTVAPTLTIEGKDQVRRLVTTAKTPWWSPSTRNGRLVWSGACAVAVMFVMFPLMRGLAGEAANSSADMAATEEAFKARSAPANADGGSSAKESASFSSNDTLDRRAETPSTERPEAAFEDSSPTRSLPGASEPRLRPFDPSVNSTLGTNSMNPESPADAKQQMAIKRGEIGLSVENIQSSEEKIEKLAKSLGGKLISSISTDGSKKSATLITIRVQEAAFEKALEGLKQIGTVTAREVRSSDMQAKYAETQAKVKELEEEERELARRAGARQRDSQASRDLEAVQQRLDQLRKTEGDLKDGASHATIVITLTAKNE
ncbi:MAG: DUF4349 domain-containing protein [Fimbriimonadaceae bacterium]|nr:DUF4349 domain-containing protein [Fimbriimonadaceae bacterium]